MSGPNVDPFRRSAYVQTMAILPIIKHPDPILRQASLPVEAMDDGVRSFLADMLETMYAAPGIGLAAIQLGVARRVIVIDTVRGEEEPKNPKMLVNPEILFKGEAMRPHEEACLSIPGLYAELERPALVRVRYVDSDGRFQEEDFEDLMATVVQHEIDHLNGVLFIDHLSRLKRDLLIKKYVKAQREKNETA